MREFTINIDEALVNGLAPDDRVRKNDKYLLEAHNVVSTELGIKEYESITDPFEGGFLGEHLILNPDEVIGINPDGNTEFHNVDTSLSPWQTSQINLRDFNNDVQSAQGDDVSITSFPGGWFVVTGEAIVFRDRSPVLEHREERYRVYNEGIARTITYHKGRLVFGGGSAWTDKWKRILSLFEDDLEESIHADFGDLGDNFVIWSSIGGEDFPRFLMEPSKALFGQITDTTDDYGYNIDDIDAPYILDMIRRNEFGFMPMPWEGPVLGLGAMGSNVLVMGEEGISVLLGVNEDISTYGFRHLMNTGIKSVQGYHSSDVRTVLVDRSGTLWRINPEMRMERLGYNHIFSDMNLEQIRVLRNEKDDEYYISDDSECYLLSPSGLTEVNERPTFIGFYQGKKVGLFDSDNDDEARIVSNTYDLSIPGLKTITGVYLGINSDSKVEVAIDYRYDTGESFSRTDFQEINNEGYSYIRVSCLDFRVVVKCDDFTDFDLDYIRVMYQSSDKRVIRGAQPNASTTST